MHARSARKSFVASSSSSQPAASFSCCNRASTGAEQKIARRRLDTLPRNRSRGRRSSRQDSRPLCTLKLQDGHIAWPRAIIVVSRQAMRLLRNFSTSQDQAMLWLRLRHLITRPEAPGAQRDRAFDYGSEALKFESLRARCPIAPHMNDESGKAGSPNHHTGR
jgi:hypothetical protein